MPHAHAATPALLRVEPWKLAVGGFLGGAVAMAATIIAAAVVLSRLTG